MREYGYACSFHFNAEIFIHTLAKPAGKWQLAYEGLYDHYILEALLQKRAHLALGFLNFPVQLLVFFVYQPADSRNRHAEQQHHSSEQRVEQQHRTYAGDYLRYYRDNSGHNRNGA